MSAGLRDLTRLALIFFAAAWLAGCDQTLAPNKPETMTLGSYGDFVFEIDSVRFATPYRWGDTLRVRFFVPPGRNACAFRSARWTESTFSIHSLVFYGVDRAAAECQSYEVPLPLPPPGTSPDTLLFLICRPNGAPLRVQVPVLFDSARDRNRIEYVHQSVPEAELKTISDQLCHSVPQKKKGWFVW
jgi:hypothetical protein